ncbi:uncharacterized protein LOC125664050 isoform X2 [Ostrea edulis]|uniref:uncharacterized protein LOC125664050 isoform X2 n=1 Tax=Ostrea edulis TaxID=37623 RepID=UPI002095F3BD|nr:uncharacterized protein LOC125664050 isoform X2 [Ostrea edulis]
MNDRKSRKPNWSDAEMNALVEAYSNSIQIIRGKFSSSLTCEMKRRAWEDVTEKVNAVTVSCVRTVKETKKKILDSQSNVKKKEAFRKRVAARTGGGPYFAVSFKPWELIVLGTIPQEVTHGLERGEDTEREGDKCYTQEKYRDESCPGATGDCAVTSQCKSEMEDLMELKRRRLEQEERKVNALERIAMALERRIHPSPDSVSSSSVSHQSCH